LRYANFLLILFSDMFQASMDLPPDKAKLLKQYDDEKKWDIICDQVSAFYHVLVRQVLAYFTISLIRLL
jgi:hypothetical protein